MTTDREMLSQPFENIKKREGAFGKLFDYVDGAEVLERVLLASGGAFEWVILDYDYRESVTVQKLNKKTGEKYAVERPAYWMVHGRLTLPGLGSKDSVGTQVEENEDSIKGAETDAFKRCAVKFGVALHLYKKDAEAQPTQGGSRQAAQGKGEKCPYCKSVSGHRLDCPNHPSKAGKAA